MIPSAEAAASGQQEKNKKEMSCSKIKLILLQLIFILYLMNIASPNEKNLYFSFTASL